MGGSDNSIKKNAAVILVASKEDGIEVNADKTNYMVMSRVQITEISHNTYIDNISFENVELQIFENMFNEAKFYSGRN